MTERLSLDRDQLQKLLESAFVLQRHRRSQNQAHPEPLSPLPESDPVPASPAELEAQISGLPQMISAGQIDLDEALDLIALHLQQSTGADGVAAGLLEAGEVAYRAATGLSRDLFGMQVRTEASLLRAAMPTAALLLSPETISDDRIDHLLCQLRGARSLIVAPLRQAGAMVGALEIVWERSRPLDATLVECCTLAAEIATACLNESDWQPAAALEVEGDGVLPPIPLPAVAFPPSANQAAQPIVTDPTVASHDVSQQTRVQPALTQEALTQEAVVKQALAQQVLAQQPPSIHLPPSASTLTPLSQAVSPQIVEAVTAKLPSVDLPESSRSSISEPFNEWQGNEQTPLPAGIPPPIPKPAPTPLPIPLEVPSPVPTPPVALGSEVLVPSSGPFAAITLQTEPFIAPQSSVSSAPYSPTAVNAAVPELGRNEVTLPTAGVSASSQTQSGARTSVPVAAVEPAPSPWERPPAIVEESVAVVGSASSRGIFPWIRLQWQTNRANLLLMLALGVILLLIVLEIAPVLGLGVDPLGHLQAAAAVPVWIRLHTETASGPAMQASGMETVCPRSEGT